MWTLCTSLITISLLPITSVAQQIPLKDIEYPESVIGTVNFTQLFGPSSAEKKTPQTWSRDSWNGLTTFARTEPLRCFGEDAGVPYDVAVLGEQHLAKGSMSRLYPNDVVGAPFDTATSYRPGYGGYPWRTMCVYLIRGNFIIVRDLDRTESVKVLAVCPSIGSMCL